MKLVRDKIPALFPENSYRQAGPTERLLLLRIKLVEEVAELLTAQPGGAFLDELADVAEVFEALTYAHGWRAEDVNKARAQKLAERGGFDEGWVLE